MQGIGAKMSQEEAKPELRRCSEELSRCNEHLTTAKEIFIAAVTIWTTIGQNPSFVTAVQKHGADTLDSPETVTKEEKKATFEGVMARGDIRERETKKYPFSLRILIKIEGKKFKIPSFD